MPFTPKNWQDAPSTATPIDAAALEDMESRGAAYVDTSTAAIAAGRFRGDYLAGAHYLPGDIVIANDTAYYALVEILTAPDTFDVASSPESGAPLLWAHFSVTPTVNASTLVLPEADYDVIDSPDPLIRYMIVSPTDNTDVVAIYLGNVLIWTRGSRPPVNTSLPFITYTGALSPGTVLTINNGQWRRGVTAFAYVWKRGGTPIGGATNQTYTLVSADQSTTLSVDVTATNISGTASPITTTQVISSFAAFDQFTEATAIALSSHTADSGNTWTNVVSTGLTVGANTGRLRGSTSSTATTTATSSWTPASATYMTRALLHASSALNGVSHGLHVDANGNGYYGQWLRSTSQYQIYKVTGGTAGGAGSTTTVIGGPVAVSGDGAADRYLQLEHQQASSTSATLTLKAGLALSSLTTVTSASVNPTTDGLVAAGSMAARSNTGATYTDSTRVQMVELVGDAIGVAAPVPVNTVLPTISGSTTVGSTLTTTPGTWTNSPTLTRQWLRNSTPISGATGLTYVTTSDDVGQSITVAETATNAAAPAGVTAVSLQFNGIGGTTGSNFSGLIFSPTGVWNRPYDPTLDLPIPQDAEVSLNLWRQVKRQNVQDGSPNTSGIGAPWIATSNFTVVQYVVNGNAMTKKPFYLLEYSGAIKTDPAGLNAAMTNVPVPPGALAARPWWQEASMPGWTGGWDGHAVVYDADADILYEFWKFRDLYGDGITPISIVVTNGSTVSQTMAAGTDLTLASAAGGTNGFKTLIAKVIPAGTSADVLIVPNVHTNAGVTSIAGASNPILTAPPSWVSNVQAGHVAARSGFLDTVNGGQGVWSFQWGGKIASASTATGNYSGATRFWGATACSLSLAGGLITANDLAAGEIKHAVAMALRYNSNRVRKPAQRTDGGFVTTPRCPAEGQRFVLDQSVNENDPKYKPWPILPLLIKAAKNYGFINRDTSGNVTLYAQDSSQVHIDYRAVWFGGAFPDWVLGQFPWDKMHAVARSTEPLTDFSGNVVSEPD